MAKSTRPTKTSIKKQLNDAGVRLPHGYEVVKKKTAKKKGK